MPSSRCLHKEALRKPMPDSTTQEMSNHIIAMKVSSRVYILRQEPNCCSDVAVLHDIVVQAQELLPKLPERERLPTNALFDAYHNILPKIGIDADHDSRYARVLFKIGGLRGPGTLFEKFEQVLSKLGIEIEFDGQDAENREIPVEDPQNIVEEVTGNDAFIESGSELGRQERRNSESSVWDLGNRTPSDTKARRNSHASGDKIEPQDAEYKALVRKAVQEILDSIRSTSNGVEKQKILQRDPGTWLDSQFQKPQSEARGRSISTHGSMRIRRRSTSRGRPFTINPPVFATDNGLEAYVLTTDRSSFREDVTVDTKELVNLYLDKPTELAPEGLMKVRACIMRDDHLKFLAKRQIRIWREKAVQLQDDKAGVSLAAEHVYEKNLLSEVIKIWRAQANDLREASATEKFFQHLEERALRARDLYLMHIAFTHWSTCANEVVQRTALARSHIVRARIFNAWRDITAVNELKVRRQVLKKFFAIWKRQHYNIVDDGTVALQKYEGSLVQRTYTQWLQRLWELKAKTWRAECAKRRALFHWIVASHENWENHRTAGEARRYQLSWNAWNIWTTKTQQRAQQKEDAAIHYQDTSCRNLLRKWRRETKTLPAKQVVQTDVAGRLLRQSFGIWLHRARQEKQAASVDRVRMLREALTHWRHKARSRAVITRIDNSLKNQIIYKFYLAGRSAWANNRVDRKRLHDNFQVWVHRWRTARQQRWEQEDIAQSFAVRRSQNLALAHWYSQMDSRKRLELAATDFYVPRLLQGVIPKWSAKSRHQQQMQKWSRDAEFYFLATKTLKRWRVSAESAKREKRKSAYAQVRKLVKVNLVRGILQKWQQKAQHVLDLQSQAAEVRQNKNIIFGMEIFDRWRARGEELAELDSLWREHVLKKQFMVWRERSEALQALKTEAIIAYQERRQIRAVKKWSLAALQIKAQYNYAVDVSEKNAKRTFRKIFNYWHQKAIERRPLQRVELSESDQLLGTTARAETWSDYGAEGDIVEWTRGLDDVAASTPIPGYLATPSKRASRVSAVAARFSTTPKAPLSTPFERQLRAQWSGGQLPSLRKGFGRSALGGFADILEHSLNDGREARG